MASNILDSVGSAGTPVTPITPITKRDDESQHCRNICVANSRFRALGFESDGETQLFWFYSAEARVAIALSPNKLSKASELVRLADPDWWVAQFSIKSLAGEDAVFVGRAMIEACYHVGVYSSEIRRGRGVWRDRGRTCIHVGCALYIDGERQPLSYHDVDCVYELRPEIHINSDTPMTAAEAAPVLQFYRSLSWQKAHYGDLACGWTVVALLSGSLRWRPHIATLGERGAGKTFEMQTTRALHGSFALNVTGSTSEAGIRGSLRMDAMPIFMDESESDGPRSKTRMDEILQLLRAASAESDAVIRKARPGGGGTVEYRPRFCAALGAIRNPITSAADHSRVTVLQLQSPSAAGKDNFDKVSKPLAETITKSTFARRFRARVFSLAPEILKTIDIFMKAAGDHFTDQRTGDQIGTLLGGMWGLVRDRQPERSEADELIRSRDWADQQELIEESSDQDDCLRHILTAQVNVETPTWRGRPTVYELAKRAMGDTIVLGELTGVITQETARRALSTIGIGIGENSIFVQNQHPELGKLMSRTSYPTNWGSILARLTGAEKGERGVRLNGNLSRGVWVVLD